MYDYRAIFLVRRNTTTVAFEYAEQAEAYAKEIHGTWEGVRLYHSGYKPSTWTVFTAEAQMGHEVMFGSYQTSDVEGTPHESSRATLMVEATWARAVGVDRDRVHSLVNEWHRAA